MRMGHDDVVRVYKKDGANESVAIKGVMAKSERRVSE